MSSQILVLISGLVGRSGSNTDKMNKNPEEASTWKGRMLVEYYCEDYKYPVFEKDEIPPDFDRTNYERALEEKNYFIIGEFGSGMCLPEEEAYTLKFCLGNLEISSEKPKNHKADWCRWDGRFGG